MPDCFICMSNYASDSALDVSRVHTATKAIHGRSRIVLALHTHICSLQFMSVNVCRYDDFFLACFHVPKESIELNTTLSKINIAKVLENLFINLPRN